MKIFHYILNLNHQLSIYENVKDFMTEEKWTGLGTPLLSMLAAESNEIVRSHFFSYNDHYYPLFNPSLVIDYQIKILLTRPDRELHSIVISSLADKLASIMILMI